MRRFSMIVVVAFSILLLASVCPAQQGYVPNYSFEQPVLVYPFYCGLPGVYLPNPPPCPNIPEVPGWTFGWTPYNDPGDGQLWAIGFTDPPQGSITTAGQGNQFVTLGGGYQCNSPCVGQWTWSTTVVKLIPNNEYVLTFKIANECEAQNGQSITAEVSPAEGNVQGTFTTQTGYKDCFWQSWEQKTLGPFYVSNSSATVTFTVKNQQYDIGLDDVQMNMVPATGGTWTPLTNRLCLLFPPTPCFEPGATLLLTDGRVLVHEEDNPPISPLFDNFSNWYTLTPDAYGSYINGTWKQVDSSPYAPLYFASALLIDAKVIIEGGEYVQYIPSGPLYLVHTNQGAIFDPTAASGSQWTIVSPPTAWATIGDAASVVLPDGTFMLANCCSYDEAEMAPPYNAPWVSTGLFKADSNNEEGWTLLPSPYPDAEVVLTVDTNTPPGSLCGPTGAEIYVNGYWHCAADTPTQLWDSSIYEMGPSVLRPDGTVLQVGGTTQTGGIGQDGHGQTAIFDNTTYLWTQGPDIPNDPITNLPLDIADGPAALLPNGNVLMMTSPGYTSEPPPVGSDFFQFQLYTNQLIPVTGPPNARRDASFQGHMLELPTGQILFTDFSNDVEIYTPTDQSVNNSWRPTVTSVNGQTCNPNGYSCQLVVHTTSTNTVAGFGFNGMSQGAAYGDDYQSATNYPLVRLSQVQFCSWPTGCTTPPLVYYCRTHDHSWMGVATGSLPVSTSFDCPGVPSGTYFMQVIANGIGGSAPGFLGVSVVP